MAFSATSYLAPQFQSYKFNWIKFYDTGTTTPKSMATDSTGGTLIAKAQVNNKGFFETAGGTVFIPFTDGFYDAYLFPTEAEADANDTSNAVRIADNIGTSEASTDKLRTDLADGTADVYSPGIVNLYKFGTPTGVDDTLMFQNAIDTLNDGDTLDLNNLTIVIKNVFITTNNVKITNGKIIAHTDLLGVMLYITGDNVSIESIRTYIDGVTSTVSKGTITFFETVGGSVTKCYIEGGRRSGVNNNVANMVCAAKCSKVIVSDNVFFEAHFVEMIQLESSTSCVVKGNVMSSTGLAYSAIATTDFYAIGGDSKHIVNGNTCTNYLTSILTINTAGVSINGNVVDISVQEQGINLGHTGTGAPDCTVSGNTVSNCGGAGIALAEASNTTVTGNVIRYCGEAGVDTSSTVSAIITGNFIHNIGNGTTGNGVKLSTSVAASYSIKGNTFKTIQGHGIEVNGSVVNLLVTDNYFSDINTGAFGGGRFPIGGALSASILPKILVFDTNTVDGTTTNRAVSLGNTHTSMIVSLSNNILPAITTTSQLWFSESGTQPISRSILRNKMGGDVMVGTAIILQGTQSIVVPNTNQTPFNRPILIDSDNDSAQIETYVSSFGTGTFTISSRFVANFDATIAYEIL